MKFMKPSVHELKYKYLFYIIVFFDTLINSLKRKND